MITVTLNESQRYATLLALSEQIAKTQSEAFQGTDRKMKVGQETIDYIDALTEARDILNPPEYAARAEEESG